MTFTKAKGGTGSFNANHYVPSNYTSTNPKYVLGITESGKLGFVKATSIYMPANKAWMLQAAEFPWEAAPEHSRGDVNHDGSIDIDDVTSLIMHILGTPGEGEYCPTCADVFEDGGTNIDDVTALISIILGTNNE